LTFLRDALDRAAAATGFQAEALEKVYRLLELLEAMRSHPYLKERIALKGGTALNLFVFDLPRLSVDIDLNYIAAVDRERMLAERPDIERAVEAVSGRLGMQIKRVPTEHAGGKWRFGYAGAAGRPGTIELDVNFLLRAPLWPPAVIDSRPVGTVSATRVPVLERHELAGGKLAALFSRSASRDLYDARNLLELPDLDRSKLHLAFVVYGAANRRDWRRVSLDDIAVAPRDVERQLLPMLRADLVPDRASTEAWCRALVEQCRERVSALLPLEPQEVEFLDRLNDGGEIAPELLTEEAGLQQLIRTHPALLWKAWNIREHSGDKRRE
jgi:predicted nucleotidyltransferase component of viral defense system